MAYITLAQAAEKWGERPPTIRLQWLRMIKLHFLIREKTPMIAVKNNYHRGFFMPKKNEL
ncbi:MAG: hypothetical protein Q8S24_08765 [Eubacteriales bacterium]|nr:hypothetical protein [Eubacteriales bacterium]